MERQRRPLPHSKKLITVASADYPTATEIVVSFPEEWDLVHTIKDSSNHLYVAGMPRSVERARSDHFYGLSPEINRTLTTYRLYKLFRPRMVPHFQVAWNSYHGEGRIIGGAGTKVHLYPLGQAQIWQGEASAVLWEVYLFDAYRQRSDGLDILAAFWQAVERDLAVAKVFTAPHEPAFAGDYPGFLRWLGYAPDPEFERWWSK